MKGKEGNSIWDLEGGRDNAEWWLDVTWQAKNSGSEPSQVGAALKNYLSIRLLREYIPRPGG